MILKNMENKNTIPFFEFHLLVGLPGSGKTYFATHNFTSNNFGNHDGSMILSLDNFKEYDILDSKNLIEEILYNEIKKELCHYTNLYFYETVIQSNNIDRLKICIDGLLITYENILKVIEICKKYLESKLGTVKIKFCIHQWDENREICIYNDKMRNRKESSEISIKNYPYENIYTYRLKEKFPNIEFEKIDHKVVKSTLYEQVFEPKCEINYKTGKPSEYLCSESWSEGGTWGSCWSDSLGTIEPDKPKEFKEFDDFLLEVCPDISFLNYKYVLNNCVEIEKWGTSDYYGGYEYSAKWKCNMRKLYEVLKERNLIKEIE